MLKRTSEQKDLASDRLIFFPELNMKVGSWSTEHGAFIEENLDEVYALAANHNTRSIPRITLR